MKIKTIYQYIVIFLLVICTCFVQAQESKDITAEGGNLKTYDKNSAPITDHPGGEAPPNVIDNNKNTKFLIFNFANYIPVYIQFQPTNLWAINQYDLISANDAPGRDPSAWVFEGSDDETNWVELDKRTGQSFNGRFTKNSYNFNNKTAFKFYRLKITSNSGDGLFQLAEFRLLKAGPPPPSELKAKATSETEIRLTWKNNADATDGTGIVIQRSADDITYDSLTTVDMTASEYTNSGLQPGDAFYYRLYIKGDVRSGFSNVAGASTKTDANNLPKPIANNILTPNGDGINDRWIIQNLNLYPRNEVKIFDRAGRVVYTANNYANDWDGTYEGKPLTHGTYFYIVKFWPGVPDLKGAITIIRDRK